MRKKNKQSEKNTKNNGRRWCTMTLGITIAILSLVAVITVIVDPFFHYHKPWHMLQYPLINERYINDGIIKNFDYDAVITGSSMTENFKTTEFDRLWSASSIKIPFAGASYKEINENIWQALKYKPHVKWILRGLDRNSFQLEKDQMRYEPSYYPQYLYDSYWFNDVNYYLNKEVLFGDIRDVLQYTKSGGKTMSFDEYANWNNQYIFGKETVLKDYTRPQQVAEKMKLSTQEKEVIEDNIRQNVTSLPQQYPDVTFYYFFTPYSICYWDSLVRQGELSREIEAEQIVIERILEVENIELYSFEDCFNVICDLGNYKDIAHHSEQVNSWILQWINDGKYRLTRDNYKDYLKRVETFYQEYPYEKIFNSEN